MQRLNCLDQKTNLTNIHIRRLTLAQNLINHKIKLKNYLVIKLD